MCRWAERQQAVAVGSAGVPIPQRQHVPASYMLACCDCTSTAGGSISTSLASDTCCYLRVHRRLCACGPPTPSRRQRVSDEQRSCRGFGQLQGMKNRSTCAVYSR